MLTQQPLHYATGVTRPLPRLTVGRYFCWFAASCIPVAILIAPIAFVRKFMDILADFNVPADVWTTASMRLNDFLHSGRVHFWIWIVPALMPLWIVHWSPAVRRLALRVAITVALLIVLLTSLPIVLSLFRLINALSQ